MAGSIIIMRIIPHLVLLTISISGFLTTYSQQLTVPRNIQKLYEKGTRTKEGSPGKNYWQNSAAYQLDVQFSPQTRLLTGTVDINYTNNSPDTLTQLWFKLYANLYKAGAPRASSIKPEDAGEGMIIDSMWMDENLVDKSRLSINGTNMILDTISLPGNSKTRIRIRYHYTVNKTSHLRTGEVEPNSVFVAYFFPRIAVYDDIDGWNKYPYIGTQEFYNDFCSFEARITVPEDFVVWATGDLQNCSSVFQPVYCQRIGLAERVDTVVTIFDSTDDRSKITRDNQYNTWQFKANDVTDFVFATSDHYTWKSTSLIVDSASRRRTRVDAVFNPKHKDYFEVVNDARKTVYHMSHTFPKWPFPYSHETVFDGLDQMEYPMMVNDNPVEDRAESIELTDHEIFHTMFPFYLGINETKYGWMDEGWATIGEWILSPLIDSSIVDEYGVHPYEITAGSEIDLPVMTLTTQLTGTAFFLNSYPKPAFGYLYIKDLLGDRLFTKALHYYISQWHGKHPMPFDFFNCMNTGSGRNLNWFWKRWFFDNGFPDQAIASVTKKPGGYNVLIKSKGSKPMPVDLTIIYQDGSMQKIHRTVGVWEKGNTSVLIPVHGIKKIVEVKLGSTYVPDIDKSDNEYKLN